MTPADLRAWQAHMGLTYDTAAARLDDATRARAVVGSCAGALASMAATADAVEARLTGLQDYVTRVCLAPVKP